MAENRQYDHGYKVQAVKLARGIGQAKAAKELGVPKNTMYGWMTSDSTAEINEGGRDDMAEHRVRKNNIIYIISSTKMTREESDAEKRKVLYHWLEMLSSLKKLHDAGETDINSTLTQLTEPAMLERINVFLSENPNLLETDRYLLLHSLLGRELYEDGKLLSIEATEIEAVAISHEFKTELEKPEDS